MRDDHDILCRTAMQTLHESTLENVTDSAYALKEGFTPNYRAAAIETPWQAGHQLRVIATMMSTEDVSYHASHGDQIAATRSALRRLMEGMRDQAQTWLDANPKD